MLPFTKRPGKGEESDVVAKDDIAAKSSPAVPAPASSSRPTSMRPPTSLSGSASLPPPPRAADFDDEMTGLVQSRQLSNFPAPLPAAGRPPASIPPPARSSRGASIPPPRVSVRPIAGGPASLTPASMRPPPVSHAHSRDGYDAHDDEDAEDDDGGRTVVRPEGAGKPGRGGPIRRTQSATSAPRSTPSANPTSISPAAVIRKTMESQRAATRGLASGPPPELRGDLDDRDDDYTQAAPSRAQSSRGHHSNYPPPASYEGPPSHRRDYDDARDRQDSAPSYRRVERDEPYASSPRSFAPRAHESGPISAPISSRNDRNDMGPPSPRATSHMPGHFASAPPPSAYSQPPPGHVQTQASMQNPTAGVNPHGPTQAMATVPTHGSNPYNAMPVPAPSSHNSLPPHMAPGPHGPHGQGNMPAHFRMAQTGAITPAMDPPAVTSATPRISGRPAMSWAAALAACGVFVGVVAVAIAQRGDNAADTQAQFVDPSLQQQKVATQPIDPQQQQPATNPLPPGLIGASPVQPVAPMQMGQTGLVPGAGPVPGMADPNLGLAPPSGGQAAAPPPAQAGEQAHTGGDQHDHNANTPADPSHASAQQGAQSGGPRFTPVAVPSAKAPPKWTAAPRPAATPRPQRDPDEEPVRKPKKNDADDETRKALEELRKAQLEQSLGK